MVRNELRSVEAAWFVEPIDPLSEDVVGRFRSNNRDDVADGFEHIISTVQRVAKDREAQSLALVSRVRQRQCEQRSATGTPGRTKA